MAAEQFKWCKKVAELAWFTGWPLSCVSHTKCLVVGGVEFTAYPRPCRRLSIWQLLKARARSRPVWRSRLCSWNPDRLPAAPLLLRDLELANTSASSGGFSWPLVATINWNISLTCRGEEWRWQKRNEKRREIERPAGFSMEKWHKIKIK